MARRAACLAKEIDNWNSMTDCGNNDWLKPASGYMWTLSPLSSSSYFVFFVSSDGRVIYGWSVDISLGVWPALYLSSKVQIVNNENDGSYDTPYELQLGP